MEVMTQEQYVKREEYRQLWPGWEQQEDGRWYSTCRCRGCVGGFTEDDFAESYEEMTAAGYVASRPGWRVAP